MEKERFNGIKGIKILSYISSSQAINLFKVFVSCKKKDLTYDDHK